ncbi:hypothetical protein THIOKS11320108 [Thiocapsa sp. KS1]|nr:hypothetical protein THIOKS11320108 [Thiocapsa sp. KS1]
MPKTNAHHAQEGAGLFTHAEFPGIQEMRACAYMRYSIADVQPLYAVDGDEVAINLLIENGFIPVNGRGEVLFQPDYAIYRLFVGDA